MTSVPVGLTPAAWKIFAVYCAAIVGLIVQPARVSVTMLVVIAFGTFVVPIGQLLSGFSNGTVWLEDANHAYRPIFLRSMQELRIFGVVTANVHQFR